MDCVCGMKDFSKLLANFKFVHFYHDNRNRKNQTVETGFVYNALEHFSIVYFGKMIVKQNNKPKKATLSLN